MTAQYQPLRDLQPIILQAGGATGPAGTEVRVDLRLAFSDTDPVAALMLELGIILERR